MTYSITLLSPILNQTEPSYADTEYKLKDEKYLGEFNLNPGETTYSTRPLNRIKLYLGHVDGKEYSVGAAGLGIPDYIMARFDQKVLTMLANLVDRGLVEVNNGTAMTPGQVGEISYINTKDI